jgi:hypothetical protein
VKYSPVPAEVIVDPEQKEIVVTPELERAMPDIVPAFERVNDIFEDNPFGRVAALEESGFSFKSHTGAEIECSLLPGKGRELLLMWAPFSDGPPKSHADDIYRYAYRHEQVQVPKSQARPNSWNQAVKSGVVSKLLQAANNEMPVLTLYSPLPSFPRNAYTFTENIQIRRGDFTPAARVAQEAIERVQDRLHGPRSETQLDTVHVQGASLGASSAIGSAVGLNSSGPFRVQSVTAQELIVAPRNVIPELARRFIISDPTGEVSSLKVSELLQRIPEPGIRRAVDRDGSEAMRLARMLLGMSKISRLKGLTHPERNRIPRSIELLREDNVSVMVPLAENSGLTHDTPRYLPDAGEQVVCVRAVEGQRTSHLIDEHVALTALMTVLHVRHPYLR